MNKKEEYRKAAAELILFDNSDVVATSTCTTHGHETAGIGCNNQHSNNGCDSGMSNGRG